MSRLHLVTGIGSYVAAPLWLAFLLIGILIALQARYIRPEYFPSGFTLFPQWPAQDPVRAAWVFGGTMLMLILPKLMGYLAFLRHRESRNMMGGAIRGLLSVFIETFVSALIAPLMMLKQSRAVVEILIGKDSGWGQQRREARRNSLRELARTFGAQTVLGALLALGAYLISGSLVIWMSAVIAGLLLAIPTAALTSSRRLASVFRSGGLLLTAEEKSVPDVLLRARSLSEENSPYDRSANPVTVLADDCNLLNLHLEANAHGTPRQRGQVDEQLAIALARLDDAESRSEALSWMSQQELFAVLASPHALMKVISKSESARPDGVCFDTPKGPPVP